MLTWGQAATVAWTSASSPEAVVAVDGPAAGRLEGHLGRLAAVGADGIVELARGPVVAAATTTVAAATTTTTTVAAAAVATPTVATTVAVVAAVGGRG